MLYEDLLKKKKMPYEDAYVYAKYFSLMEYAKYLQPQCLFDPDIFFNYFIPS